MKRYCKNIDITDRVRIQNAVYQCLEGKYTRNDVLKMLEEYSGLHTNTLYRMIITFGKRTVWPIIEWIIDDMRNEIVAKKLKLKPIWYKKKTDPSSGKVREIGIQDIKQQMYDYLAVNAMDSFIRRIGEFQVASIKGKGQAYGIQFIRKWMRNKKIRYAAKADIKKCYESIEKEKLMGFLRKYIKNENLLWLIENLISTFRKGLSIGSYLSQFLCNLYLSQLYHYISEQIFRIRKHKNGTTERISPVKHVIFYMDDIMIMGTNKKDIHKSMRMIIAKANELGLKIKSDWAVYEIRNRFTDMMGAKIYRAHIAIRKRVFKRIRRTFMRIWRLLKMHRKVDITRARRAIAYYGIINNTNSFNVKKKYHVEQIKKICARVISNESKIFGRTAAGACC